MLYTEDVKKKLDAILIAFENYIDGQDYFDIVYSKKIGYAWIVVDPPGGAGAERLDTPEKMLGVLFNEVINDVINAPENPARCDDTHTLTEWEEAESRRQLTAILETIEDGKTEYLNFLDAYMKDYRERYREDSDGAD